MLNTYILYINGKYINKICYVSLQILFWYDIHISTHTSAIIALVPLMISSSVKTLKFIARMSAFANINMMVCLIVILYYCSIDLPPITSRVAFADWNSLPLFFGTTIFAFEGISLVSFHSCMTSIRSS